MYRADLLKGRHILITGGGTGLGKAMAQRFAELGAKVSITGRRAEPLKETSEEIRAKGGAAFYATCDVRDFEAVEKMIEACERAQGPIDTLVNNAAGNFIARTEKLSANAFNAVVGIVLQGSFYCTLVMGRKWIAAKKPGNVLCISTTYASSGSGSGYVVPSACAKAGVLAMTRSLAVEWAPYKIRLNAIAPGPFPTQGAFSRLLPSAELEERAKNGNPMKRFGRPEELANLAVYLISAESEYVNGECVVIDGGEWLKGAGEFNMFGDLSEEGWAELEKPRKK
jgi:NAD(P)-dependent dehydrogenase (short-subunit alcohol dehydrogenase family)